MTTIITQQRFSGERSLFNSSHLSIKNSVFENGESPLKESTSLDITDSIFKWKYPLWYCSQVTMDNTTLTETARSGIWYTDTIKIANSIIQAPKTFRQSQNIRLENVYLPKADETLWHCRDIELFQVQAEGDYFAMNSENIFIKDFSLSGNYAFDSAKNVEIHDARLLSKDAFWNCENVTVYDSVIIGEYLGWNAVNLKFVNCFIESEQGMCYVQNLVIENGTIINTNLAFEYSTVDVATTTTIDSIKNPFSGRIQATDIKELILEKDQVDSGRTEIQLLKKQTAEAKKAALKVKNL